MEPTGLLSGVFNDEGQQRDMENEEGKEETERVVFPRREEKIYREICTHRKRNGEVSGGSGRVESRLRKQRGLFTVCIKAIMSSRGIEPPL